MTGVCEGLFCLAVLLNMGCVIQVMEIPDNSMSPFSLRMILGTNDQNTCLEYEQVLPFLSLPSTLGENPF